MTRSSRSKRGFGLLVGLAFWSLGSTAIAHTSSGEAATEQMARAQAMRMAPKGATVSSVDCVRKKMWGSQQDFAAPLIGQRETNDLQDRLIY